MCIYLIIDCTQHAAAAQCDRETRDVFAGRTAELPQAEAAALEHCPPRSYTRGRQRAAAAARIGIGAAAAAAAAAGEEAAPEDSINCW